MLTIIPVFLLSPEKKFWCLQAYLNLTAVFQIPIPRSSFNLHCQIEWQNLFAVQNKFSICIFLYSTIGILIIWHKIRRRKSENNFDLILLRSSHLWLGLMLKGWWMLKGNPLLVYWSSMLSLWLTYPELSLTFYLTFRNSSVHYSIMIWIQEDLSNIFSPCYRGDWRTTKNYFYMSTVRGEALRFMLGCWGCCNISLLNGSLLCKSFLE